MIRRRPRLRPLRPRLTRRLAAVVLLLAAAVAAVLALRAGAEPEGPAPEWQAVAAAASIRADLLSLRAGAAPASLTSQELVRLGYRERLRLGLGSPFRLMDQALRDPRLSPQARAEAAWDLLDAALHREGYEVDTDALLGIGAEPATRTPEAAALHRALVEWGVRGAESPRAGELAVRLAYEMAAAEHLVSPRGPTLAAGVAALARDRELARRDALRVLARADELDEHPMRTVPRWRARLRLEVEAPVAAPRTAGLEAAAAQRAVVLLEEIRRADRHLRRGGALPPPPHRLPPLPPPAAKRLAALAEEDRMPPRAALLVTLGKYAPQLLARAEGSRARRRAVERLVEAGTTEERFAAELALALQGAEKERGSLAWTALEAALAMRPLAQEPVWFPGFPAPTEAQLKSAYGIRAVEFDDEVPKAWRPYYLRMVDLALADLELVLPNLTLQGMRFRVGRSGREGFALAIHDPGRRAVVIPAGSGAGTIAHEVAHDLDWQVARDRYGRRGAYGTDLAVERRVRDSFAAAARSLPERSVGDSPRHRRYAARPAETFARTLDGYVASMLALQGRMNGYLSSAQDETLPGYASAILPDRRAGTADLFVPLLQETSPVPPHLREQFLRWWGRERPPGGPELVADVLDRGDDPPGLARPSPRVLSMDDAARRRPAVLRDLAAAAASRDSVLSARQARRCALPLWPYDPDGEAALRALVHAAHDARARGIVRRHARALGLDDPPAWLVREWSPARVAPAGFVPSPASPADTPVPAPTLTAPWPAPRPLPSAAACAGP